MGCGSVGVTKNTEETRRAHEGLACSGRPRPSEPVGVRLRQETPGGAGKASCHYATASRTISLRCDRSGKLTSMPNGQSAVSEDTARPAPSIRRNERRCLLGVSHRSEMPPTHPRWQDPAEVGASGGRNSEVRPSAGCGSVGVTKNTEETRRAHEGGWRQDVVSVGPTGRSSSSVPQDRGCPEFCVEA